MQISNAVKASKTGPAQPSVGRRTGSPWGLESANVGDAVLAAKTGNEAEARWRLDAGTCCLLTGSKGRVAFSAGSGAAGHSRGVRSGVPLSDLTLAKFFAAFAPEQIIAVRTVAAQPLFVEEPLDTAIQTNSVGVPAKPNRPAHLLVAAATENQRSGGFENALQNCSPLATKGN